MSILSSIKSTAGSLFSTVGSVFRDAYNKAGGQTASVANAFGYPKSSSGGFQVNAGNKLSGYGSTWGSGVQTAGPTSIIGGVKYYNNATPQSAASYIKSGNTYTNTYSGATMGGNGPVRNNSGANTNESGGYGGESYGPAPVFDKAGAQGYARSAGLSNLNLEGKTQEEADQAIRQMKDTQAGQVNANTSYSFTDPNAISNTNKKIDSFQLALDNISNDQWTSTSTKQDKIGALLKATASDIATDYNTPDEIANAYHTNPQLQQKLDQFAQAGGSDQMLTDAITAKGASGTPNNMTTGDYLASTDKAINDAAIKQLVPNDQELQDEIARTANIPKELKDYYFGDEGIMSQRVKIAEETLELLKEKLADEKASLREKANLAIDKNNAELDLARSTIEQNRINAKNYMTGMLAKLGALQTTSAAVDGITTLDEKYQRQTQEAESKVRMANQEIGMKLREAINDVENQAQENSLKIREDLSKDNETIMKELMKEQNAADKRVYELTSKWNAQLKKNNDKYISEQSALAEDWATQFARLVSPDFGGTGILTPKSAAGQAEVKLSAADSKISLGARIKDPQAIAYFKSLPSGFQKEWVQYASTQPQGTFFTIADLQMNYAPYAQEQQDISKTKKTGNTSIGDITI